MIKVALLALLVVSGCGEATIYDASAECTEVDGIGAVEFAAEFPPGYGEQMLWVHGDLLCVVNNNWQDCDYYDSTEIAELKQAAGEIFAELECWK